MGCVAKAEHIPDIMKTQLFTDYKFYRLLEQDDAEGRTYVVQFFSDTAAKLDEYLSKFAPTLRDKAFSKWGNKFIAFRTKMEVVQ